jgi:hypothetical protein
MKSIMQDEKKCYFCGNTEGLDEHHVFGGNPGRQNAEKYGLKIWVCNNFTRNKCHKEIHEGVETKELMHYLHREGQKAFERECGTREDFMRIFGRNYL